MNPLLIAGLAAGAGLLGKWAGRGFKGSPFESDREYWMRNFQDLVKKFSVGQRKPEDYRRAIDIVYGSERASTEATASQRALASGLTGGHIEAMVSKAVQPIDIARLGVEFDIIERADKNLIDAISMALSFLQGYDTETPFGFGLGLGFNVFGLAQDILLGKEYLKYIQEYIKTLNKT